MIQDGPCPICRNTAKLYPSSGESREVACPRCTIYRISRTAERIIETEPLADDEWVRVSGSLRGASAGGTIPVLSTDKLMYYRTVPMPDEKEKCLSVLIHLVGMTKPGEFISIDAKNPELQGIAWAGSAEELFHLLTSYMQDAFAWFEPAATPERLRGELGTRITAKGSEAAKAAPQAPPRRIGF